MSYFETAVLFLLVLIAGIEIARAYHDFHVTAGLHRVMTNLTDSTQHATSRAEQLADAIATLPRRIAQQFPHAADTKVVPYSVPAPKPVPTVTTEQLGAGMVPPVAPHMYDPARMEALEAKLSALRDRMQPPAETHTTTLVLDSAALAAAIKPAPEPAAQPMQLQTEPGATVAATAPASA